jgi:hypothetical protein
MQNGTGFSEQAVQGTSPEPQRSTACEPTEAIRSRTASAGGCNRRYWLTAGLLLVTAQFLPKPQFRELW